MGSTTPSERRTVKTKRQGASFTRSRIAWMTTALFLFNLLTIYFYFQTTPGFKGAGGDGLNLWGNFKGAGVRAGSTAKGARIGQTSNSAVLVRGRRGGGVESIPVRVQRGSRGDIAGDFGNAFAKPYQYIYIYAYFHKGFTNVHVYTYTDICTYTLCLYIYHTCMYMCCYVYIYIFICTYIYMDVYVYKFDT